MATLALPSRTYRSPSGAELEAAPAPWSAGSEAPEIEVLTLDDRISGLWFELAGSSTVSCPACSAAMTPRWSAGSGVVGGRCGGCGSTLE